MLNGKHLIAGEWVGSQTTFENAPMNGVTDHFGVGTPDHVDAAAFAAEQAFPSFGYSKRAHRAEFLRAIATEIDARGDEITAIGVRETGLPEMRLNGERGR